MNVDAAQSHALFSKLAQDIRAQGYSVKSDAVPIALADSLLEELKATAPSRLQPAQMGRLESKRKNQQLRGDSTLWITDESNAGADWLNWTGQLQTYLNRHLLLGLFSFESHYAHYPAGSAYTRHLDTFHTGSKRATAKNVATNHGQSAQSHMQSQSQNSLQTASSRVLSLVAYLNRNWPEDAGGELMLYIADGVVKVQPCHATLVVFLSDEFEHEVRPASVDRFSVAGWFRRNTSDSNRVDPPN
ncbi:MAG: 2OG-Fe(II) oxygenase [Pseudomonadota bacterium]